MQELSTHHQGTRTQDPRMGIHHTSQHEGKLKKAIYLSGFFLYGRNLYKIIGTCVYYRPTSTKRTFCFYIGQMLKKGETFLEIEHQRHKEATIIEISKMS